MNLENVQYKGHLSSSYTVEPFLSRTPQIGKSLIRTVRTVNSVFSSVSMNCNKRQRKVCV